MEWEILSIAGFPAYAQILSKLEISPLLQKRSPVAQLVKRFATRLYRCGMFHQLSHNTLALFWFEMVLDS
jgi:hypothetical protein